MSIKAGSRFAGNKVVLGSLVAAGLLAAQVAFGVQYAPGSEVQMMPAQGTMQIQTYGKPVTMSGQAMPCAMTNSGSQMYQSPCGNVMFSRDAMGFNSNMHSWFALMLVLTVMMIWVVLLLLIGVLWHMLKKHRKGHSN